MRYWKRVDANWNITTVESYSHDLNVAGAIEISQDEFDTFIRNLPPPVYTAADLPQSTVAAIVKSIAQDKKSCIVTRTYRGVNYDISALVTATVEKVMGSPQPTGIVVGDTVMLTYLEHAIAGTKPIVVDKIAAVL